MVRVIFAYHELIFAWIVSKMLCIYLVTSLRNQKTSRLPLKALLWISVPSKVIMLAWREAVECRGIIDLFQRLFGMPSFSCLLWKFTNQICFSTGLNHMVIFVISIFAYAIFWIVQLVKSGNIMHHHNINSVRPQNSSLRPFAAKYVPISKRDSNVRDHLIEGYQDYDGTIWFQRPQNTTVDVKLVEKNTQRLSPGKSQTASSPYFSSRQSVWHSSLIISSWMKRLI